MKRILLLVSLVVLIGCGGGGGSDADVLARFVGTNPATAQRTIGPNGFGGTGSTFTLRNDHTFTANTTLVFNDSDVSHQGKLNSDGTITSTSGQGSGPWTGTWWTGGSGKDLIVDIYGNTTSGQSYRDNFTVSVE
jgi:hypothetical protein